MSKKTTLKEVSELITKGTTPTSIGGEFTDSGIYFVKSESICDSKFLNRDVFGYIDEETDRKLKRSRLAKDDLLFSIAGAYLGKIGIVRNEDLPANTNQAVGIVRLNKNIVDVNYVFYYFSQNHINQYINKLSSQSSQPNLNLDLLGKLEIELKDINTQQKIAAVLSSLDSKIELNNKINAELEAMAKTLYDYWFVQFDFPDKDGKPYKTSGGKMVWNDELKREIPDGWEVSSLKDIVELVKGNVNPSDIKTNTPYVGLEHIGRKTIVLSDWANSESANSDKTAFKKHDILFGKIRPYFHKVAVATFDGITSTDTIILRPKENIYFGLALQTVFTDKFIEIATQSSTGSKMPRADWNVLQDYKFPIPKSDLLKPFQNVFESALNKIEVSVIENQTLSELRDWLLPMLMNGQVKVT